MMQRFELEAKMVVTRARDQAMRLNHDEVRSEHILLALLADRGIRDLLIRMGLTRADVRTALELRVTRGPRLVIDDIDVATPEVREVCAATLEEVDGFGHSMARSGHLLLGLVKVHEGVAGQVLEELGATVDGARHEVLEHFAELGEGQGAA